MARKNRVVSKTRRGNNEGCITQRKDGRWAGIVTIGYDENGKQIRKSVYGKTRMEVANKLTELTNRLDTNNLDYIENNTFGGLMKEWLLVFKKNQVSPRTFEHTFRNFQLHIEPKVGKMKLDEVNSIVIQKVLNGMLEQKYSLAVVKKVKFIFNQFFNYAVDNNLVATNPTTKTRVRSTERKIYDSENEYKAIPIEVREKFVKDLENHKFLKPLCYTMMFAGLRAGETFALTWKNVDFANKCLNIEKATTTVPKIDDEGKVIERVTVVSDTKTSCSVRTVPMPDILIKALEEHKFNQELNAIEHHTDLTKPTSFVFANDDGSVRTYSGTKNIFYRFLKKYNLDKYGIHFHGLRHTYSNMLFEADQNPKVIQALLGHKSVKTTLTTYNSVDKSYFQKATDVINKQYSTDEPEKVEDKFDGLDEEEWEELERLVEKRRKKKERDFEM